MAVAHTTRRCTLAVPLRPETQSRVGHLNSEHVDGARRAEADHVRQPDLRALDLARARAAAQILRDLEDVGDAGGAERMPLGEQTAGDVHWDAAAPLDLALVDQASRLTVGTQPQVLVV